MTACILTSRMSSRHPPSSIQEKLPRSLRNRTLDMNVLVSLGVLVAYLFSVFATLFAPQVDTSYDAAAMLVTFVLFGHWMEMRSRRGSSDALNALLRLAPTQANVIGSGTGVAIETVEVVLMRSDPSMF